MGARREICKDQPPAGREKNSGGRFDTSASAIAATTKPFANGRRFHTRPTCQIFSMPIQENNRIQI
jgi:hypothetical protein